MLGYEGPAKCYVTERGNIVEKRINNHHRYPKKHPRIYS